MYLLIFNIYSSIFYPYSSFLFSFHFCDGMLGCFEKPVFHPKISPDFKALRAQTVFSVSELKRMFARFCLLSNEDGLVSKVNFLRQPELAFLPLAELLFDDEAILDPSSHHSREEGLLDGSFEADDEFRGADESETLINFDGFVRIFNALSPKAPLQAKYKCAIFSPSILYFLAYSFLYFSVPRCTSRL